MVFRAAIIIAFFNKLQRRIIMSLHSRIAVLEAAEAARGQAETKPVVTPEQFAALQAEVEALKADVGSDAPAP